jgi:hypothetical protein
MTFLSQEASAAPPPTKFGWPVVLLEPMQSCEWNNQLTGWMNNLLRLRLQNTQHFFRVAIHLDLPEDGLQLPR